jgi:hypothetical protein
MNWRSLLLGDKTPLIIATALTVFGWYVDSISRYFSDTPVIYVAKAEHDDGDDYLLKNVSISKTIESLAVQVQCLDAPGCLKQRSTTDTQYGVVQQVAPFAGGSQTCFQNERTYQAQVTLPPSATVRIRVNKKPGGKTDFFMTGKYGSACLSDTISTAAVRVEVSPSAIAFLLQNFVLYYFISIVVLLIVFLATVARLASSGATSAKEGENVPRAIVVDLYIRRNP